MDHQLNFSVKLPTAPEGPLEAIYNEVTRAIDAGLYYAAIAVVVSFPDICATLEGHAPTTATSYKAWFVAYAAKHFKHFDEHACYELRCGVSHNAKFQGGKTKRSTLDGLYFTIRNDREIVIGEYLSVDNGGVKGRVLSMDARLFCEKMISAAREWESVNICNQTVIDNMPSVVRLRPNGFPPHITGLPVIA